MKNLHKNIGIFASTLFVTASAVYLYSPTFGLHAAETKEAEVSLTIASTIGLNLDKNNLALEANVGDFVTGTINASVTSNSQYGYTLTLEDVDNDSSLIHSNTTIEDKLTSDFTGAKTSAAMADNTWGFSLDATDYYRVPTFGEPVALKRTNNVVSSTDSTLVTFGAKVGASLTAGTYADHILFTAYVNGVDGNPDDGSEPKNPGAAPETRTISDLTNMQDMNKKVCSNSEIHETATLTDTRDGSSYTIAKLKDGRCWMTSNLEIQDTTITSADSDVPAGYTYHVPASTTDWSTGGVGFVYELDKLLIDDYGGHYTFYVASAGHPENMGQEAVIGQSICPKGWRLPHADYDTGEFKAMVEQYAHYDPESFVNDYLDLINGVPQITMNGQVSYGTASYQGAFGAYWSSSATYASAKRLFVDSNPTSYNISYDGYASESYGFGVRCIAK